MVSLKRPCAVGPSFGTGDGELLADGVAFGHRVREHRVPGSKSPSAGSGAGEAAARAGPRRAAVGDRQDRRPGGPPSWSSRCRRSACALHGVRPESSVPSSARGRPPGRWNRARTVMSREGLHTQGNLATPSAGRKVLAIPAWDIVTDSSALACGSTTTVTGSDASSAVPTVVEAAGRAAPPRRPRAEVHDGVPPAAGPGVGLGDHGVAVAARRPAHRRAPAPKR